MVLIAPLSLPQSKKKNFIFNLNVYRNAHYLTLNRMKVAYKEHMGEQIALLPVYNKVRLTYTLFPATARLCDVSNVLSVHDKFFCDALVELGKLEDDNYKFLPSTSYKIGEIDRENPRVEIQIEEID